MTGTAPLATETVQRITPLYEIERDVTGRLTAERAIRPSTLGWKNWLFRGSDGGGVIGVTWREGQLMGTSGLADPIQCQPHGLNSQSCPNESVVSPQPELGKFPTAKIA